MMNPLSTTPVDPALLDVRESPCSHKHAQIFGRWDELPVGGHFILVNHHDPVPLRSKFSACFPGAFTWEYLLRAENEVRIRISRLKATAAGSADIEPCNH